MSKVLVSFEESLLRRIDRAARAGSKTRSAYLAELAEDALSRRSGPGKSPAVRSALRRIDKLVVDENAPDSTEAIRVARDAR